MGLKNRIINILGGEVKTTNALSRSNDFLKYGPRQQMLPDWSEVKMSDEDMYRGYTYAAIQKRGNKVASLARTNLKTLANEKTTDEYQKENEIPFHPYLKIIEESTDFTEKQFWKNISIYLDLAGRYYLGVVRNHVKSSSENLPDITTDVKKFIMLNPYEIRRVVDKNGELAGYVERKKDGRYREWPVHQIIEMKELNPFDGERVWSMTSAAKEAVYTINQSSDYTRKSLDGNIDAPGIITTDVLLNDEDFTNFRARVQEHKKGEPLFGNGSGAINWQSMQVDLDKAALLDINEINRTTLFAVSGTSKTTLGIEQSGTTRETARVQTEAFISDTAQPRLEDIIDFLNLDYKKYYQKEFAETGYFIEIASAVSRDYDTEIKAIQARKDSNELALELIEMGYTKESSYQYANGEIEWTDLQLEDGKEKPERPKENPDMGGGNDNPTPTGDTPQDTDDVEEPVEEKQQDNSIETRNLDAINMLDEPGQVPIAQEDDTAHDFLEHVDGCTCEHDHKIDTYVNDLEQEDGKQLTDAYDNLLNDVRDVQKEAIKMVIDHVDINSFAESDIIDEKQKKTLKEKLKNAFRKYWFILLPLFANNLTNKRNREFDTNYKFTFTNDLQDKVILNAEDVANGHLETILRDILDASNKAYTGIVENAAAELIIKAYKANPEKFKDYFKSEPTIRKAKKAIQTTDILDNNKKIYEKANKLAEEGYDRATIIKAIRKEYKFLSETRANTIARNETSRAFTQSQYQADYQFLKSINKLDSAYKQLYSRSGNPCPYCQAIIDKGPIPFEQNFLDKGESITINSDGNSRTFTANYEDISAGVVHVNCSCSYRLILKEGKAQNEYNSLRMESDGVGNNNLNDWVDSHSNTIETKEINGGHGSGNHNPGQGRGKGKPGKGVASGVKHQKYSSDGKTTVAEWDEVENPIYKGDYILKSETQIGVAPNASDNASVARRAYIVRDKRLKDIFKTYDCDESDTKYIKDYLKDKFNLNDTELQKLLDNVDDATHKNGGSGSGNFGHLGRPGKVGGSAATGSVVSGKSSEYDNVNADSIRKWAQQVRDGEIKKGTIAYTLSAGLAIEYALKTKDLEEFDSLKDDLAQLGIDQESFEAKREDVAQRDAARKERAGNSKRNKDPRNLENVAKIVKSINVSQKDETWLKNNCDTIMSDAFVKSLDKAKKEYGLDIENITLKLNDASMTNGKLSFDSDTGKYFMTISKQILRLAETTQKSRDRLGPDGDKWWTSSDIGGTFDHELGHAMESKVMKDIKYMDHSTSNYSDSYDSFATYVYGKAVTNLTGMKFKVGAKNSRESEAKFIEMHTNKDLKFISKYGMKNTHETIAESFANPNYSKLTKEIHRIMTSGEITIETIMADTNKE